MIGLYGGSFDPVHIGHLRIAEDIREYFSLEKIIFIPAYHSPLKDPSKASPQDRLNMLKISIEDNPYFDIDDIEIKRKGKSYTIDTINIYREKLGYYPFFIVGTDAFLTLDKWKNPEELIRNTNFIVVGRGKDNFETIVNFVKSKFPEMEIRDNNQLDSKKSGVIYFFSSRRIDISSTEIRSRIKTGKSIKYLVLPQIEKYILNKKLYRG
ncbi:nicotinate (nicotinamide) nucleotide adenylyltransferase [Persephonella sp. KM09-Lau-8]|uniref:nicotinate (nicotinamide) nucleotide adenylyltransferase n=1 Tax=Persephonella sp. KM09-Lau-8 TaxID=1158345 RepID=UPI000497B5FE|nr:nicotinate (nicotinamide) nucleotide adenylyltransferase [Persephonella sp. KM09-Lau-8]